MKTFNRQERQQNYHATNLSPIDVLQVINCLCELMMIACMIASTAINRSLQNHVFGDPSLNTIEAEWVDSQQK
jgi:hypothetical protein